MDKIWQSAREALKNAVTEKSFETWIAPLALKKIDSACLVLEAPDKFFKDWVETHYTPLIKQALKDILQKDLEISFDINPDLVKNKASRQAFKTMQKSFQEMPQDSLRLNPRYNLDNFIIGACNRMAHAAATAVATAPGKSYNPLFIYGGSGLGKTHLMQAVAHYILEHNPQAKVKYTSSEKFTTELIMSIQNRSSEKFRQKYREIDVLLIDDIHFLAGKEAAQEEFFHTFNALYDYHKQIVISSDRPPKEIPRLEERLVSRFGWGLVVDVQPPDFETRVAILKKKLEKDFIKIDEAVLAFIAQNISTNVRELEGALVRVIAYASLEEKPITLDTVREILKDMFKEIYRRITPEMILEKTAVFYNIPAEDLKKGRRNKNLVLPRQTAMYLIRELTELSFPEIGAFFGAKHHTTILYSYKKMLEGIKTQDKLKAVINSLTQEIKGG